MAVNIEENKNWVLLRILKYGQNNVLNWIVEREISLATMYFLLYNVDIMNLTQKTAF